MAVTSSFAHDSFLEQALCAFLDEQYKKLGIDFQRISDKNLQNCGVDIIVKRNDEQLFVDEKAQLDYIGKSIPTFAFEIGGFKNDEYKIGWLFDDKKITTHYMLITNIHLSSVELTSSSDVESVRLLWINREALQQFLAMHGYDKARCEFEESNARSKGLTGKIKSNKQGLYFYLSNQKAEAPFNIVISRSHLLQIGKELFTDG